MEGIDLRLPRRSAAADEPARTSSPSPKRSATRVSSAFSASFASRPFATTVIVEPMPAPSVRMPMIEVAPTVSPQRVTVMSASKAEAHCTNFAVARACSPFLLTIWNSP